MNERNRHADDRGDPGRGDHDRGDRDLHRRSGSTPFLLGVGATLAVLALIGLVVVYGGTYNVAVTEGHTAFVRWAFSTTMHNSVQSRADSLTAPAEFTPAMIRAGATQYKEYCEHCHGGPGSRRAEWAQDMLPMPPYLVEAASEWSAEEVFWIVQHGIKMSGMPAFGPSHSPETLWNIAAFVKQLPAMTPAQFEAFEGGHEHGGGSAGGRSDEDGGTAAARGTN